MAGAFKRALVWLGVAHPYTDDEAKDAETDNLVVDRERTLSQLSEQTETFKTKTEDLVASVEQRKGDLDELLDHIRTISHGAASARTILERVLASRREHERRPPRTNGHFW